MTSRKRIGELEAELARLRAAVGAVPEAQVCLSCRSRAKWDVKLPGACPDCNDSGYVLPAGEWLTALRAALAAVKGDMG